MMKNLKKVACTIPNIVRTNVHLTIAAYLSEAYLGHGALL